MDQTLAVFGFEVRVLNADITKLKPRPDAVVSSDDSLLTHGGGVSAAIWRAAGDVLLDNWAAHRVLPLRLGDVAPSPGGHVANHGILHAVTIDFAENRVAEFPDVQRLYGRVLDLAADRGWDVIAIPLLATGAAGLPVAESAAALRSALRQRRFDAPRVKSLIVTSRADEPIAAAAAAEVLAKASAVQSGLTRRDEAVSRRWAHAINDPDALAAVDAFRAALDRALVELGDAAGSSFGVRPHDAASALEAAYARAGKELPPTLAASVQGALRAEARVVHRPSGRSRGRNSRRILLKAAEDILLSVFDDVVGAEATLDPPSEADPPVHALHGFLLASMAKQERVELIAGLRADGAKGTDQQCLLEYCVSRSPADIVASHFTLGQLRRYLTTQGKSRQHLPLTMEGVVGVVLRSLGFERADLPPSVEDVLESASRSVAELALLEDGEVLRRVRDVSNGIEHLVFHVVRFYCRNALGEEPAEWAMRRQLLTAGKPLSKLTMGSLFGALRTLNEDLRSLEGAMRDAYDRDFGGAVLPTAPQRVVEVRNSLMHGTIGPKGPPNVRAFFEDSVSFLTDLGAGDPPLCPAFIQVRKVVVDEWERRTVVATDGRHEELIFTSEDLRPGQVYLMRPMTNPVRLDPILMPAGD